MWARLLHTLLALVLLSATLESPAAPGVEWIERYASLHRGILAQTVPEDERRFLVWSCRYVRASLRERERVRTRAREREKQENARTKERDREKRKKKRALRARVRERRETTCVRATERHAEGAIQSEMLKHICL